MNSRRLFTEVVTAKQAFVLYLIFPTSVTLTVQIHILTGILHSSKRKDIILSGIKKKERTNIRVFAKVNSA